VEVVKRLTSAAYKLLLKCLTFSLLNWLLWFTTLALMPFGTYFLFYGLLLKP